MHWDFDLALRTTLYQKGTQDLGAGIDSQYVPLWEMSMRSTYLASGTESSIEVPSTLLSAMPNGFLYSVWILSDFNGYQFSISLRR